MSVCDIQSTTEWKPEGSTGGTLLCLLPKTDVTDERENFLRARINALSAAWNNHKKEAIECSVTVLSELCYLQSEWIASYGIPAIEENALLDGGPVISEDLAAVSDSDSDELATDSLVPMLHFMNEEICDRLQHLETLEEMDSKKSAAMPKSAFTEAAKVPVELLLTDTALLETTEEQHRGEDIVGVTLLRLERSLKALKEENKQLKHELMKANSGHVTDEHLLDGDKLKHEWEQRADSGERTEERRALLPPLRARRRSSGVRDADINDGSGFFDALCARNGCF